MNTTETSLAECAATCESCAAECDRILATDPLYTTGATKFTPEQIALVTCADVCRITAAGLREQRDRFRDICQWCADVCDAVSESPRAAADWPDLGVLCHRCAEQCRAVA